MQVYSKSALASRKKLLRYNKCRFANRKKYEGGLSKMDMNSLAHMVKV